MNKKHAKNIVVSLSNPSKMPCKGYSLPAAECKTGSKLREQSGTVCSNCYACKGCYSFSNVQKTLYKRLEAIQSDQWVKAMAVMIGKSDYFRWHDSGDLQNLEHFAKIIEVCKLTPKTSHWLPTKEKGILNRALKAGLIIPDNLIVRYSMPLIDQPPQMAIDGINTSHSVSSETNASGHLCRAYENNGECGTCRACWNKQINNIAYLMH